MWLECIGVVIGCCKEAYGFRPANSASDTHRNVSRQYSHLAMYSEILHFIIIIHKLKIT